MILRAGLVALLLLSTRAASAEEALPPGVDVVELGSGRLFVNAAGMTLYTFKRDQTQPGTSVCNFGCAELWPPLTAPEDAEAVGNNWSTIKRNDGTDQWAYGGKPVYTYARDFHPGAMAGEQAAEVWDVLFQPIGAPPGIAIQGSLKGQILVNTLGQVLYAHEGSSCDEACLTDRLPVEAPWLAGPMDDAWTVVPRADGLKQWAFKGQPLFTYAGDHNPGEMNGEDPAGGWQVVVLQAAPAVPDWVTFQETDLGPVLANEERMTLYYPVTDAEQIRRETCDDDCVKANWQPVVAAADASPVGNWSPRQIDGTLQWTYLGLPVVTYRHDLIPGDISGDKFGSGVGIRGGWRAIEKQTLVQKLF